MEDALLRWVLARADDALVLGHRLSEWVGRGPMLEEEMALANLGLDLLGQARVLYARAASIEGDGRDEDWYPFARDARAFGNLLLVEQPNGDFARSMVRQLFYSAFADPYWRAMASSGDAEVAALAARSEKESAYHLRHAAEWVIRLGDGTAESHRRTEAAVAWLWPCTGELFEAMEGEPGLVREGVLAVAAGAVREAWETSVGEVFARAGLARPAVALGERRGGRDGWHGESLGHMLAEMQSLARSHPGASW